MLPNLISYKKFNTVKLIKNSGIQFMDFGLKLDFDSEDPERQAYWKEHGTGRFIQSSLKPVPPSDDSEDTGVSSKFSWKRLVRDPSDSYYCDPGDIDTPIDESVKAEVKDAVSLFDGEWLPLPFFSKVTRDKAEDHKKTISDNEFNKGPGNWARFRIARITDRDDIRRSGYTHLLTIAFDTRIFDSTGVDYK